MLRVLGVFAVVLFDSVVLVSWLPVCWWVFVDVGISFCDYYAADFAAYGVDCAGGLLGGSCIV